MMTGVISGEINSPITALRAGIAEFASPRAAKVPSEVASRVAETPMTKLLTKARVHTSSSIMLRYQRSEYASGSKLSMPSVNVKYGSALKLSGTITKMGVTKKTNAAVQNAR